jgi:hypothetical protein
LGNVSFIKTRQSRIFPRVPHNIAENLLKGKGDIKSPPYVVGDALQGVSYKNGGKIYINPLVSLGKFSISRVVVRKGLCGYI